jgi:hypothetical protein
MGRTLGGWYRQTMGEKLMMVCGAPRGLIWSATCRPEYVLWSKLRYFKNYRNQQP